jgi:hypothetical protein
MNRFTTIALVTASAFLAPVSTFAQQPAWIQPGIRNSLARVRFVHDPGAQSRASSQAPPVTAGNHAAQKAKAAVGLGFLGMLAGGFLGGALTANCHCDDPGLAGAMVGAPAGAAAGAILGWNLGR